MQHHHPHPTLSFSSPPSIAPPSSPFDKAEKEVHHPFTWLRDERDASVANKVTYSGYQKGHVKKALLMSLLDSSKLEQALYWTAELFAAGQVDDLWDVYIVHFAQYIRLDQMPLCYLLKCNLASFQNLLQTVEKEQFMNVRKNFMLARNHKELRHLFAETSLLLCILPKDNVMVPPQIKEEQFDILTAAHQFKAPHSRFALEAVLSGDPQEWYPFLNEFAFCVTVRRMSDACFWIEWMVRMDSKWKKQVKQTFECAPRDHFLSVPPRCRKDSVWMIWDQLVLSARHKDVQAHSASGKHSKIIDSLLHLFSYQYKSTNLTKRKPILHLAVRCLCEWVPQDYLGVPLLTAGQKQYLQEFLACKLDWVYEDVQNNQSAAKLRGLPTVKQDLLQDEFTRLLMTSS